MNEQNNGIILFHYNASPVARRVVWYLIFRGLNYAQCMQPPVLPRPDVKSLGVSYRRIPIVAIGKDVYCDSGLILHKLEKLFPNSTLGAPEPDQKAVECLLQKWTFDGGIFTWAAGLIPPEAPLLKDPKFAEDREDFSGRSWKASDLARRRPEALVYIRDAFQVMETTLLADGRDWILKTPKPSLADIEAIWPFHWLTGMRGALPHDLVSKVQFPRVFSWIHRFNEALKDAKESAGKPATISGPEALNRISAMDYVEPAPAVDENDPLRLTKGEQVRVRPTDSGFRHYDQGDLIGLSETEVVINVRSTNGTLLRLHSPRTNFRVEAIDQERSRL